APLRRLAAATLMLAATTTTTWAQEQIEPYVFLAFDTSGSMRDDTCGAQSNVDATFECSGSDVGCGTCDSGDGQCGDSIANDSRLGKAKLGASLAVNAFGEVTFALARFHQEPDNFSCKRGGWSGAPFICGFNAVGTGWTRGDVLVGFYDDNQDDILDWMNLCDDYPTRLTDGVCPATLCPGNCDGCAGAPICTGPGASCMNGCDKELRGAGFTPNAGLLRTAYSYLTGTIRLADPKRDCRPYTVILLTDGEDTCPGDPATEAATLFGADIPVYAVGFAGEPGLIDELDDVASAGGTGSAIMIDNSDDLALAMAGIVASSILVEQCNGADDDCDDWVDESFPALDEPCDNGQLPPCYAEGSYVCTGDGSGTVCTASYVEPGTESCNGID
ncbi:MAG: hypothetical protein AABZ30_15550, partial [Myxococcota bacterium]